MRERNYRTLLSYALVGCSLLASSSVYANCAAIAYNAKSRAIGWATDWTTLPAAQSAAIKSNPKGAIVTWVCDRGFVAIAIGDNGWATSGVEETADDAVQAAVNRCSALTTNCQRTQWVGGP